MLKAEFSEDDTNLDYKAYRVRFFWMRSWNWARTRWKCAAFICGKVRHCVTAIKFCGYVNRVRYGKSDLCYGGRNWGETLHPVVVKQFGEEIWNAKEKETSDFAFSYMIASSKGKIERQSIIRYLQDKGRKESEKDLSAWDNNMIYAEMERILRHRGTGHGKGYDRKMIYVE